MSKDKRPLNNKGQRHGYSEVYFFSELMFKCFFQNGKRLGYEEEYWIDGKLFEKTYNI